MAGLWHIDIRKLPPTTQFAQPDHAANTTIALKTGNVWLLLHEQEQ